LNKEQWGKVGTLSPRHHGTKRKKKKERKDEKKNQKKKKCRIKYTGKEDMKKVETQSLE